MTEPEIDALCLRAGDDALQAVGRLLPPDAGAELKHIALMAAASMCMGVAAQTFVRGVTGQHPPADDPAVVAMFHWWADALKLYPDHKAIGVAMTQQRERMEMRQVMERWEVTTSPAIAGLLIQMASCRDPLAGDKDPDVDDCVETLSKLIRAAKSIVGDREEPELGEHIDG